MWGWIDASDRHEGTKAQRNTKGFAAEKRGKGGGAEMIFLGGFVAGDCQEGTKAQRNTKVFAAEKRVKKFAQR